MSDELQEQIINAGESDELRETSNPEELGNSIVALPTGKELSFQDSYSISATETTIFVVLAGATGCGKTTLITSLYQGFLQEIPDRYYFAGSQTIQAFEQRAYLSRIRSGQTIPQMQRTIRGSVNSVLHLRVWDSLNNMHKNLLLTDFSGEDFDNITANIIAAKEEFSVVSSAKFIIILLDGENIISNKLKHKEIQRAIHTLRTFSDADLLHPKTLIIVVVSKYDLVHRQCNTDHDLEHFVENILDEISKQIPKIATKMVLSCISAMPKDSTEMEIGYGVNELLNLILDTHISKNDSNVSTLSSNYVSEFNHFQERVL